MIILRQRSNFWPAPSLAQAAKVAPSISPSPSGGEMTMRFEGNHRDKLQITSKAEGDGFMTYALCDDDYCYQLYF